jgi:mannose-1-phosphate guanylyltransferase/mannose-6-phosphate isomerase
MIAVILAGGSGKRLWPLSRSNCPKQFLKTNSEFSTFQKAVRRSSMFSKKILIVLSDRYYYLAKSQVDELQVSGVELTFVIEPTAKNTYPAIVATCSLLALSDVLLIQSADHAIDNDPLFLKAAVEAEALAQKNNIVCFAKRPLTANTNFGYVEANQEKIVKFHEKPNQPTADAYLKDPKYLWNLGIFCFSVKTILEEAKQDAALFAKIKATAKTVEDRIFLDADLFSQFTANSIDYEILEKTKRGVVVKAEFGWSDVGSFPAIYDLMPKDADLNANETGLSIKSQNNLVLSKKQKVFLSNVNDLEIIVEEDWILINDKNKNIDSRSVSNMIERVAPQDLNEGKTVHRPWGYFSNLLDEGSFKVKKIVVRPGYSISLQRHAKRDEHWVVVDGQAVVTKGETQFELSANEYIFIKKQEIHRIENVGQKDATLIEVQYGSYLGEDDIERLEDRYLRADK